MKKVERSLFWGLVGGVIGGPIGAGIGAAIAASTTEDDPNPPSIPIEKKAYTPPSYPVRQEDLVCSKCGIGKSYTIRLVPDNLKRYEFVKCDICGANIYCYSIRGEMVLRAVQHSCFQGGIRGFILPGKGAFYSQNGRSFFYELTFFLDDQDRTPILSNSPDFSDENGEFLSITQPFEISSDNSFVEFSFFVPYGCLNLNQTTKIVARVSATAEETSQVSFYSEVPFEYFVYCQDPREGEPFANCPSPDQSDQNGGLDRSIVDFLCIIFSFVLSAEAFPKPEIVREFKSLLKTSGATEQELDFARNQLKNHLEKPIDSNGIKFISQAINLQSRISFFGVTSNAVFKSGSIGEKTVSALFELGRSMEIPQEIVNKVLGSFVSFEDEYYSRLGLIKGVTLEELKQAYRKKCLEFHPDKYQALPNSFQNFAKVEFQKVQEAYDYLSKRLNG
jgi:hypothetical protein